ncbi:MAG: hypothetical protein IJQ58_07750 [Synergistaceae bacterium]|nr:hypothetical protein [Synergistaceae bacterium]
MLVHFSRFMSLGFLENSSLTLITGITESNLNDAITLTKSAHESGIVTAGSMSGSEGMKSFLDAADAVIISRGNDESEIINGISDLITKIGFVNLDIEDITEILKDAGTVYYGTGTAKTPMTAAKMAVKMCEGIANAKRILLNTTTGTEIMLSEMSGAANVIEMVADPDAQIIWGHVIDEDMGENVRVRIFAAMNDK